MELLYEIEMLLTSRRLSKEAQQTIIDKLGDAHWKQGFFLNCQTIRVIKVLPLPGNFRRD